jgi:hypothetical protein
MNTETIVHPKLQHVGLATANLEAMKWRLRCPRSGAYTGLTCQCRKLLSPRASTHRLIACV